MELELKKECLDTYELGEPQTLTQEETAETIVPDYCPDIARIISAEGVVCLHGGIEQDGVTGTIRVTLEGGAVSYVSRRYVRKIKEALGL